VEFALLDHCQPAKPFCRWRHLNQLEPGQRPPRALAAWLADKGSLTAKLINLSQGRFRVQLLSQRLARPRLDELRLLGLGHQSQAVIREVVLYGNDQPWVFARSLIPLSSLTGQLRRLRKQGTRPLGAFLFSQPRLQRGQIAVCALNRHHGYLPESLLGPNPAWGRRSVFSLDQRPLVVSEVFLEPLQQLICNPVQD
jgi:chorismate--pyruvate lyase